MNAIVLHHLGGVENFYLDKIVIPSPKKGEVRIQIKAAAFNPVDSKIRRGDYGECTPVILGADCSGIIDAIGKEADHFAAGEEVYAMAFGQSSNGTYAQYVCLPEEFVAKKPTHLSFEEAASIPLAALTAYRATLALQPLQRGGSVFVAGAAGGVGSFAVQFIRHFYSDLIYTVAGSANTVTFLKENLGVKEKNILPYRGLTTQQLEEKLMSLNGGNLFSATFDFVGKEMKTLCAELTAPSGHMISTVPEESSKQEPSFWSRGSRYFERNLSAHAIFVGAESYFGKREAWHIYHEHLSHITHLLNEKKIKVPPYQLLGKLSVDTVQSAHSLLESGRAKGKLVMSVD